MNLPSRTRAARPDIPNLRRMPDGSFQADPVPDRDRRLERFSRIAELLDTRWRLPVLGWRFGIDGLAGLFPGAGDVATGLISAWLILEARRLGVPRHVLVRMLGNVAADVAVGAVPVLGSIFDFAFKSNTRNLRLLRRHLERDLEGRR